MELSSGLLICPKCKHKGIENFNHWTGKKQYINRNQAIWKYILYESFKTEKKWVCLSSCRDYLSIEKENNEKQEEEDVCWKCIFIIFKFCIIIIPYILIFLWIDIYKYYNKEQEFEYINAKGLKKEDNKSIKIYKKVVCRDIWEKLDGLSEIEWRNNIKIICSNCKYQTNSIYEFIGESLNKKKVDDDSRLSLDPPDKSNLVKINDIIAFNLNGLGINFPTLCKKTDKFLVAENKLLNEYSDFKSKNIFYLKGGKLINKNMTIEENGIKNAENIDFYENIMNAEDTMNI